jgi:ABC-type spermidine/putrescine transport system permease subunit I
MSKKLVNLQCKNLAHALVYVTSLSKVKFQKIIVSLQHVMLPQLVKKQLKHVARTLQAAKIQIVLMHAMQVLKLAKKQLKKVMHVLTLLVVVVQMAIAKSYAKIVLKHAEQRSKLAKTA